MGINGLSVPRTFFSFSINMCVDTHLLQSTVFETAYFGLQSWESCLVWNMNFVSILCKISGDKEAWTFAQPASLFFTPMTMSSNTSSGNGELPFIKRESRKICNHWKPFILSSPVKSVAFCQWFHCGNFSLLKQVLYYFYLFIEKIKKSYSPLFPLRIHHPSV